jgi:hypothetical protein
VRVIGHTGEAGDARHRELDVVGDPPAVVLDVDALPEHECTAPEALEVTHDDVVAEEIIGRELDSMKAGARILGSDPWWL